MIARFNMTNVIEPRSDSSVADKLQNPLYTIAVTQQRKVLGNYANVK
jgi:hypothetical protein